MLSKLIARVLRHPVGLTGRYIAAPLWNRRNVALNDTAFSRLRLRDDDRVLEVGFGGGYLLRRIAEVISNGIVAGVDSSPAMVAATKSRLSKLGTSKGCDLHQASSDALPFPDRHFNKACSVNSIFYWQQPDRSMAELFRVLCPGGLLVFVFTCRESLQKRNFVRHGGINAYDVTDVHRMLSLAGFGTPEAQRLADRRRDYWCLAATKPDR